MGTNFYLVTPTPLPDADTDQWVYDGERVHLKYHIGKRSGGWEFGFRIYPPFITSFRDWRRVLVDCADRTAIEDEYGKRYGPFQFFELVEATRHDGQLHDVSYGCFNCTYDPEGWSVSTRDFS